MYNMRFFLIKKKLFSLSFLHNIEMKPNYHFNFIFSLHPNTRIGITKFILIQKGT